VSDRGGSFGRMPGVVWSTPSRRRCASRWVGGMVEARTVVVVHRGSPWSAPTSRRARILRRAQSGWVAKATLRCVWKYGAPLVLHSSTARSRGAARHRWWRRLREL